MLTFEEFCEAYKAHMFKINHNSEDIKQMFARFRESDYWFQYGCYLEWFKKTYKIVGSE